MIKLQICPKCGSDRLCETTMGSLSGCNPNTATCQDCGWKGPSVEAENMAENWETKYKPGQFVFWETLAGDKGDGIIKETWTLRDVDGKRRTQYFIDSCIVDEACIDLAAERMLQ